MWRWRSPHYSHDSEQVVSEARRGLTGQGSNNKPLSIRLNYDLGQLPSRVSYRLLMARSLELMRINGLAGAP